jgi:CheY-like chemotaxis protein
VRHVSVLVVDDDFDIRDVVTDVLEQRGYTVASACDGAEALELLRELRPGVILLDLNMPVMSGSEFRAVQERDPALRAIPTVVMTAVGRMREHVAALNVEQALAKPMGLHELLDAVARYVPRP